MGIDSKEIQLCLCRVLQIFIKSSYRFVQRHPLVLGALSFPFLLYLFLPYIFTFLVYSSPLLICIAILLRIFWSSENSQIKIVKGGDKKKEGLSPSKSETVGRDVVVYRNGKYSLQSQKSRRRNVKEKNKECDGQAVMEETKMASLTVCNDDSTIGTIPIEENTSLMEEKEESTAAGYGESSSADRLSNEKIQTPVMHSEPSTGDLVSSYVSDEHKDKFEGDGGSGCELEADNSEEVEDEDEEEAQDQDGNNKAVEWTEDDQQNLMDLGISEIERNKRLESLIARRRARKLLKMQIEKGLIDVKNITLSQIAPLFITRNNPLDSPNGSEEIDGLHIPGSAPSALRPGRNPFDIPYDPSEEKPNLMGDSFHEEFMAAHQKEMLCRHESFSLGPFFPFEPQHDQGDMESNPFFISGRKATDRLGYSRYGRLPDKGNHDWLIEQLLYKGDRVSYLRSGGKALNEEGRKTNSMTDTNGEGSETTHGMKSITDHRIDVHMEPKLIKDNIHDSSLSSLTVEIDLSNAKRVAVSENTESGVCNSEENFPCCSIPKSIIMDEHLYNSSSLVNDRNRMFYTEKGPCHTPTYSIASDLQVEVSEIGSPPRTPTDEEPVTYDGDIEKEITSDSEDMGGASSHLSGVEENESKPRQVHETNEENIVGVGLSGINKKLKEITSSMHMQQIDEENSADVSSWSSSRSDISSERQHNAINVKHNIIDDVKEGVTEIGEPQPSNTSDVLSPALQTDNSMDCLVYKAESEKSEEYSNPSENLGKEVQLVHDVTDPQVHANHETENFERIEPSIAPTMQQDFVLEEIPVNSSSSSSPKSVLVENNSANQVFAYKFEEKIHLDVPQTDLENTAKSNSNDEYSAYNTTLPKTDVQLFIDDAIVQSSDNGDSKKFQDGSLPPEEFTNDSRKLNKPMVDDKKGNKETKSYEGKLETSINHEASISSSNPVEDINNLSITGTMNDVKKGNEEIRSYEAIEGKLETSISHGDSTASSKPTKGNNNSGIPGTMEPTSPPRNSVEETDVVFNVNDQVVSGKEEKEKAKSDEECGGQSQSLNKLEATMKPQGLARESFSEDFDKKCGKLVDDEAPTGQSKPTQENDHVKDTEHIQMSGAEDETTHMPKPNNDDAANVATVKDVQGESENLTEPVDLKKLAAEGDVIHISEAVQEVLSNPLLLETHKVNKDGCETSVRQKPLVEPPITVDTTDSTSTKDTERKSEELTEKEAIQDTSGSTEKTTMSRNTIESAEPGLLIGHENAENQPKELIKEDIEKEKSTNVKTIKEEDLAQLELKVSNREAEKGHTQPS